MKSLRLGILLACLTFTPALRTQAADPPGANTKTASYVATGSSAEADLAKLQATLAKLPGVLEAQVRPAPGGAVVRIRGEHLVSVFSSAAKTLGYLFRPAPTRYFVAAGPAPVPDLQLLQAALTRVEGVEQLAASKEPTGVALRVTGVAAHGELVAAGKAVGFTLRQLGSYVVSGPTSATDLSRLRGALIRVSGVEQVELQGLAGGATLLVFGNVADPALVKAAAGAGFALWPLANLPDPLKFRISGHSGPVDAGKLREALQTVDGIGDLEVRSEPDGPCLTVVTGRARPEAIVASGKTAGFTLLPVETVSLPSLIPAAGRNTPPDYEERVLEEQAKLGELAPDFTLLDQTGLKTISLSQFRGKKPVVLMFGSCT